MCEKRSYFFEPRIGTKYKEGFRGYRTLVVGVHHICKLYNNPQICTNRLRNKCLSSHQIWDMDTACPVYKNAVDKIYSRLSNSNYIEVDAYLEGGEYPLYSSITKLFLGKRDALPPEIKSSFWESVAFTNYLQHYVTSEITPPYSENKEIYIEDVKAFEDMLKSIDPSPEVVIILNESVKQCIDQNISGSSLVYRGELESQIYTMYLYTSPDVGELGDEWSGLKIIDKPILRHIHNIMKRYPLLELISINPPRRGKEDFSTFLKSCCENDILLTGDGAMAFSDKLRNVQKEFFYCYVKHTYKMPHGAKEQLKNLLGYNFMNDTNASLTAAGKWDDFINGISLRKFFTVLKKL